LRSIRGAFFEKALSLQNVGDVFFEKEHILRSVRGAFLEKALALQNVGEAFFQKEHILRGVRGAFLEKALSLQNGRGGVFREGYIREKRWGRKMLRPYPTGECLGSFFVSRWTRAPGHVSFL